MHPLSQAECDARIAAGQTIVGADLSTLSLETTDFDGVTLDRCTLPPGVSITAACLSGSTWRHCHLPAVSFRTVDARDATFEDCRFYAPETTTGADLRFCDLRNTRFLRCDLQLAVFEGCDLYHAMFEASTLRGASFPRCTFSRTLGRSTVQTAGLFRDCDLGYASLSALTLTETTLTGCILAHCDLSRTDLSGADLTGNTFLDTDLTQADLSGADLRRSTLTGLCLTDLKSCRNMAISADQQHALLERIGVRVHTA